MNAVHQMAAEYARGTRNSNSSLAPYMPAGKHVRHHHDGTDAVRRFENETDRRNKCR